MGAESRNEEGRACGWKVCRLEAVKQPAQGGGRGRVPTGSSEHSPQGDNSWPRQTHPAQGSLELVFSAGFLVLFLYLNSSIVSSSLKVDIPKVLAQALAS